MKCNGLNLNYNATRFKNQSMFKGEQYPHGQTATNLYAQTSNYDKHITPRNKASSAKNPASSLASLGILQAISSGLQKLSQICSYKLAAGREFTDSSIVKKIAANMKSENGLDTVIEYITPKNVSEIASKYGIGGLLDEVAKGRNAFFMDAKKLAVAPEAKPSLILHELGHAINAKKSLTKFLQNTRKYTPYVPTAILLASQLVPDKKDGKPSLIKKYGGLLGFAAFLPTIIEEALASFRGIKAAKGALGNSSALKTLTKNYGFALATYIISGIALGISTKIALKEREAGIIRI